MAIDHRGAAMRGKRDRLAMRVGQRQRARPIAERGDDDIGVTQMRLCGRVVVAGDMVKAHTRFRCTPVDPKHPQHQFARFQPEAGKPIDKSGHRADILRAEIGEPLGMRRFDRRIERAQLLAVKQGDCLRPPGQRWRALEQQRDRGDRAGRAADHGNARIALAGKQIGNPFITTDR